MMHQDHTHTHTHILHTLAHTWRPEQELPTGHYCESHFSLIIDNAAIRSQQWRQASTTVVSG